MFVWMRGSLQSMSRVNAIFEDVWFNAFNLNKIEHPKINRPLNYHFLFLEHNPGAKSVNNSAKKYGFILFAANKNHKNFLIY